MSGIIVIGAGVVGLAIAIKLKEVFPEWNVAVVEKNKAPFLETSRFNSGVIHSGIHQKPELLKSKLAYRGGQLLADFCAKMGVSVKKPGMLIAVSGRDMPGLFAEISSLALLYRNSRRQGIPIKFLTAFQIKKMEPDLRAAFGVYLPEVSVVDQKDLGEKMFKAAKRIGVNFIFGANITDIKKRKNFYEVVAKKLSYYGVAGVIVNATGIRADEIAALAGFSGYKIFPCRGEYYEVVGWKKDLIRSTLIYPALPPGHPVKGIHLTKTADGRLLIGPNAKPWPAKDDDFQVQTSSNEFLAAVKRFLPQINDEDLRWAYSGLRAKINPGVGEDDFVIKRETANPTFINLIGIESPGLTASFAIAEYAADMIVNNV